MAGSAKSVETLLSARFYSTDSPLKKCKSQTGTGTKQMIFCDSSDLQTFLNHTCNINQFTAGQVSYIGL